LHGCLLNRAERLFGDEMGRCLCFDRCDHGQGTRIRSAASVQGTNVSRALAIEVHGDDRKGEGNCGSAHYRPLQGLAEVEHGRIVISHIRVKTERIPRCTLLLKKLQERFAAARRPKSSLRRRNGRDNEGLVRRAHRDKVRASQTNSVLLCVRCGSGGDAWVLYYVENERPCELWGTRCGALRLPPVPPGVSLNPGVALPLPTQPEGHRQIGEIAGMRCEHPLIASLAE
jgi:hypothetical protein